MKTLFNTQPRKLLLATAAVIVLGTAGVVYAQSPMNQARMTERFDYIFTELNLTEDQRTEVMDIVTNQMQQWRNQHREQRDEGQQRPHAEERQAQHAQARTALADQLGMVLQADQVEGFMTYLEAHQPRGGKGMQRGHEGGMQRGHGEMQRGHEGGGRQMRPNS
ncbi:MAG: hypothetical protein LAT65_05440 [Saccharospirillum sp.]|nr:hypothetical protein [Saccharospirillum sp.]